MKKIIFMLLIITLLIGFSNFVNAETEWVCLSDGETYPINYECESYCCILCSKNGYSSAPYNCAGDPMCSCDGGNSNDFQPPTITINSPVQDEAYGQRSVLFDVDIDEDVRLQYRDNNEMHRGFRDMCTNCDSYYRDKSLDEGFNNFTLRAFDHADNVAYIDISFMVDSKNPRIRDTLPDRNEYGTGEFMIEYDEVNLQRVELHYGNPSIIENMVVLSGCESGNGVECSITVDLSPYEGGQVEYYFVVEDLANSVSSSPTLIEVDTIAPILDVNAPINGDLFDEKKVYFDINVNEESTIEYIDYSDRTPKWKRLCSRCNSYDRSKNFNDGLRNLGIRASDEAGNYDEVNLSIMVDSKNPKIRKTYPTRNKYGNGEFIVEYDEDNVVNVKLHYGVNAEDNVVDLNWCESGQKMTCSITVDLTSYNEQDIKYYFSITDVVSTENGRTTDIHVDSVAPIMTLNSPEEGLVYNDRRILFDIGVNEDVTIEYIDNLDNNPKWTSLCRNCNDYNRTRSFRSGNHDLVIRATDKGGNMDEESVSFSLDY